MSASVTSPTVISATVMSATVMFASVVSASLKVHKNENFFGFDFEFCTISMLVMQN